MDLCHLCAQAETYLATGPLANEAAAESRLVTLDLTLRHHRVQIDELLLRLQQRSLDHRLDRSRGKVILSPGQATAAAGLAPMIRWQRRG
jgi:hypothetical protein